MELVKNDAGSVASSSSADVRQPGFNAALIDELLERLLTAQTSATDAAFNAEIERVCFRANQAYLVVLRSIRWQYG